MHFQVIDRFYPKAEALRRVFDKRFEDPLRTHSERFVWDYWHVPGEYTLLRTPAYHYFPKTIYTHFHRYLVRFGREKLGCHDISPPWLSCYIEGCWQETHVDVPHGPLAFVYSLTRWENRPFQGGETFIVRPRTLIPAPFNRLTLFNPSLPHGVRPVKGTHDPREGRLVIHGWFVQPRPFWVGPLTANEVRETFEGQGLQWQGLGKKASGFISLRLNILPSGRVSQVQILINTLSGVSERALADGLSAVRNLRFPARSARTQLTLPLMLAP